MEVSINCRKRKFLEDEFLIMAWNASVQRNCIYEHASKSKSEGNKKSANSFRMGMKLFVRNMICNSYSGSEAVSHDEHINNIKDLQAEAIKIAESLNLEMSYNIGTAQKFLNLTLKYYWCANLIKNPPPHCPIDSIIQGRSEKAVPWTEMEDAEQYVSALKKLNGGKSEGFAEWELKNYKRRNSIFSD